MDFKLLYKLIFGLFSLKKNNMRFPNVRRVISVLIMVPIFMTILVINKLFLLLDYLLVPFFLTQKVEKPVFIVASPRSGTTYLYHSLANKKEDFTCFKLWEIILAPSVIQKVILYGVIRLDRLVGAPLKWIILKIENLLIGKLKTLHPIGLNMPEEDDAILLWDLASTFLNFFYPDSHFFDDYMLFDTHLSERKRMQIMRSYRNYVRRHNFVFNRSGRKQFLAKNPLMMCKLESLHAVFPDAIILNTNRGPQVAIPSTIALNNQLYGLFTSTPVHEEIILRTKEILIKWFRMAHDSMKSTFSNQHLEIDFLLLKKQDPGLQEEISKIVGRDLGPFLLPRENSQVNHQSKNRYEVMNEEELNELLLELPFMKKYCE